MYISGAHAHGRIYFEFSSLQTLVKDTPDSKTMEMLPKFCFCSFPGLSMKQGLTILKIDTLIWSYLKADIHNKEGFDLLAIEIVNIVKHRTPLL